MRKWGIKDKRGYNKPRANSPGTRTRSARGTDPVAESDSGSSRDRSKMQTALDPSVRIVTPLQAL